MTETDLDICRKIRQEIPQDQFKSSSEQLFYMCRHLRHSGRKNVMMIQVSYVIGDFLPLTFSLKCLFSAVAVRSDATVSLTSFLFSLRSKAKALKTSCCGGRLLEFILATFCCSFPSFTDCSTWITEARSAGGRSLLLTLNSGYFRLFLSLLTSINFYYTHQGHEKSPSEQFPGSKLQCVYMGDCLGQFLRCSTRRGDEEMG